MKKKILVIGSTNTDMVIRSKNLPNPGETILGGHFFMSQGGKGANQAVAAARLGGDVAFITKLGRDLMGEQSFISLQNENIKLDNIFYDREEASGIALIMIDEKGENCISVASGANGTLSKSEIDQAENLIIESDIIVMQLEISLSVIEYVVDKARKLNKYLILNPAPVSHLKISEDLLSKLDLITPNKSEAELISGIYIQDQLSAENAAREIIKKGCRNVIITLGSLGALICTNDEVKMVSSNKVTAVDTTAAGDCFNGALAVALSEGMNIEQAVLFANTAASISVTRMGAQPSLPFRCEMSL